MKNMMLILAALLTGCYASAQDGPHSASEITKKAKLCDQIKKKYFADPFWKKDLTPSTHTIDSFFSKEYNTCVISSVATFGNDYRIIDSGHGILKDYPNIFFCDDAGANSILINAVRLKGGNVSTTNYKEFLDNGEGGLPRTLLTPTSPYSREKCKELFDHWILQLKK